MNSADRERMCQLLNDYNNTASYEPRAEGIFDGHTIIKDAAATTRARNITVKRIADGNNNLQWINSLGEYKEGKERNTELRSILIERDQTIKTLCEQIIQ